MAISSLGSLSRVSTSVRTFTLISQLQQNATRVFQQQQRISSGERLLSIAEDPVAAEKITRMLKQLDGQEQILDNLRHADHQLAAADSAITEINDLLIEAARIASEQAGSIQSAEERAAQAVVVDGLLDQFANIANRQLQTDFLFSGRSVNRAPISTIFGRLAITADQGIRSTLVDIGSALGYNIRSEQLFRLDKELVGGYAGFDVQLNFDNRISELRGATNTGVQKGSLDVTEGNPPLVNFQVDLSATETIGDMIVKFNDDAIAAGSSLRLGISAVDGGALAVSSLAGNEITVAEVGVGTTASDLGIEKSVGAGQTLLGDNLGRMATGTTLLSDLVPGGITLPDGVVITNDDQTRTVTFTGATTLQEVLNALNGTGLGIRAQINENGDGIEVANLIAGTRLVIGENGGTDAETLGIKTMDPSVLLSRLNGGRGIHPVLGDDIRIRDANGIEFTLDLSNAVTVGDVINAINNAAIVAGANITAQVSSSGAGFMLTGPGGPGAITVTKENLSPVAEELGILGTGTPTQLDGAIVGEFVQTGIFSALYRLRDGLLSDDGSEITEAGSQINDLQYELSSVAGEVGARSKDMQGRFLQTEDAVEATQVLMSELRDVDFVEAVTRFQEAQTALQASLTAGSQTLSLSLMDFLR